MQLLHLLIARFRAWRAARSPVAVDLEPFVLPTSPPLLREVSSTGVRFYSLCGCCGARLDASATLCNACAQRRSPSSPF